MPEKTLKEKVDLAKGRLENIYDRYTRERISEALLALEARVEELEGERDLNRLDYLEAVYERDGEFCVPEMYQEMNNLKRRREEAPDE
jgi:hypothetical protein